MDASIKDSGACAYCGKLAQSNFEKHTLILERGDDGHLVTRGTHKRIIPICFEHKAAYIQHLEEERENEIEKRYRRYSAWCRDCGYEPSSLAVFTHEKRYEEWM